MSKKSIVIVILISILITVLSTTYLVINRIKEVENISNNSLSNNSNENIPNKDELDSETISFEKMATANVVCQNEVEGIIPAEETVFDIQFDKDVSEEYVKNTFSIVSNFNNNNIEHEIIKNSPSNYTLKTTNELQQGAIYNVVEETNEGTKKWAFQTEKTLQVSYTYPNNNKTLKATSYVEINFNFNVNPEQDINEYITIQPSVQGTWNNYDSNRYRFEHNATPFVVDQIYTVRIKKGLKDDYGNTMQSDYSFKFKAVPKEDVAVRIDDIIIDSKNVFKTNEPISLECRI